jgi:predicted RNase H-like HicB family nuclease
LTGMGRRFTVDEDGYYVGSVLELPGCHTQAQTLKTLMERIREAIELYLETVSMQTTSK